jgi:hypothetical protein
MHDHGSAGKDYCIAVMAIGNGMIQYRSSNRIHTFNFPLSHGKEATKNSAPFTSGWWMAPFTTLLPLTPTAGFSRLTLRLPPSTA